MHWTMSLTERVRVLLAAHEGETTAMRVVYCERCGADLRHCEGSISTATGRVCVPCYDRGRMQ